MFGSKRRKERAAAAMPAPADSGGSESAVTIVGPSAAAQPLPANEAVLGELSAAFADRSTITIGGDDELPDAVYLDDELERGVTTGRTLFIDDDGSEDAVAPKEASTRGIEPRLRQRRIGVRRAESRRRLRWFVIGGVVLLIVIAALAVLGSSLFDVDEVDVNGNVYTDPDQLQAVVDDLMGTPVLLVDTQQAEADLEAIPWVEDARVRTSFPNSASIELRERTPLVAMAGADGLSRVLDRDGRVLDSIEGEPVALVWISGPGTLDAAVGDDGIDRLLGSRIVGDEADADDPLARPVDDGDP